MGYAGVWGYVTAAWGSVSFILCDIARELGATVAAGVPVARFSPARACNWTMARRFTRPSSSATPIRA